MDITCRLAQTWLRCVTLVLLLWLRMERHVASVDVVNLKPANASVRVGSSLTLYCRYVIPDKNDFDVFLFRFRGLQIKWRKHLPAQNVSLWTAENWIADPSAAINKVSDGLLAYNITSEFSASTEKLPKFNNGHDLTISNFKESDAGTYSCSFTYWHNENIDPNLYMTSKDSNQAVVTVSNSSDHRLSGCMNRNCSGLGYCVQTTASYKYKCVCEFGITGQDCETEFDEELPDCESHSTIGHEAINRTHHVKPDATTKLWTFVHTQPFESEGTIKTIEFFAFALNTLEVGLYKPVSERLCHLQMEKKTAVVLIEEGYNKIDLKQHGSEMRFRRGYYFGFTWRNGEVIPYDSTERTEYCEGGVYPRVGDILSLHADDPQSRREYSINVTYRHELCDVMDCESQPCIHGKCVEAVGRYECRCERGYSGLNCETDIDECLGVNCTIRGKCIDLVDDFRCKCIRGYTGRFCRINIDDCEEVDCSGNGECEDHVASYECMCELDFTGKDCERKIDDCKNNQCYHGTCYDLGNDFRCDCLDDYTGRLCDKVIDYCMNVTCNGRGTCTNSKDGYSCKCNTNYKGKDCEEVELIVRIFGYFGALLEGDELSMTCITNHLEIKLTYKWVFLQLGKTLPLVVSETDSYRKKGITEQDAGEYQCEATVPSSLYRSSASANSIVNVTILPFSSNAGSSEQLLTMDPISGTSLLIGMVVGGVIIALLVIGGVAYIKYDTRKRARDVEEEKLVSDVGFYMHGPCPIAPVQA